MDSQGENQLLTPKAYEYFKIYSIFKNNLGFFFHHLLGFFSTVKNPPGQGEVRQGSRRSASGAKTKCAGGQGKVRHGSRGSASAEYHTFS